MRGRGLNRRDATALFPVAGLGPPRVLGSPPAPPRAARRPARAPEGNFLLERVLARDLSDGASIVVTRRWRAAFLPRDRGMFVDGEQIFAAVAAPPGLQALASLEQSRAATAMFPIALDAAGLIVGTAQQSEELDFMAGLEDFRKVRGMLPAYLTGLAGGLLRRRSPAIARSAADAIGWRTSLIARGRAGRIGFPTSRGPAADPETEKRSSSAENRE